MAQTGTLADPVTTPANTAVSRDVAAAGSVLLKNENAALPVPASTRSIAVIGEGGASAPLYGGGGSSWVNPTNPVTPYQGIRTRAGSGIAVDYWSGSESGPIIGLAGKCADVAGANSASGTPIHLWECNGTGAQVWTVGTDGTVRALGKCMDAFAGRDRRRHEDPALGLQRHGCAAWIAGNDTLVNPVSGKCLDVPGANPASGTQLQLWTCHDTVAQEWAVSGGPGAHQKAVDGARAADLAIVFVSEFTTEGGDLPDIDLPAEQNRLVADVAAANPNTVVVVNTGSAVTMPWAGAVRAIVAAWYPGQEYGNALASLLFGDIKNPSGKLPVTFPASLSQVPARHDRPMAGTERLGAVLGGTRRRLPQVRDHRNTSRPSSPSGSGCPTRRSVRQRACGAPDSAGNVAVSFDVTNTGARAGSEVAQVYVGQPPAGAGEPPKNLRGFAKVPLNPGQTQRISVTLDARSFQHWDDGWSTTGGTHLHHGGGVVAGHPVDRLRLAARLRPDRRLPGPLCRRPVALPRQRHAGANLTPATRPRRRSGPCAAAVSCRRSTSAWTWRRAARPTARSCICGTATARGASVAGAQRSHPDQPTVRQVPRYPGVLHHTRARS